VAHAVPIASLHGNNAGIGALGFAFDPITNTITLTELWTGTGPGIIEMSGLDDQVDYTIIKIITNNSGVSWSSIAQELLDPEGFEDDNDAPAPPFAPAGFTSSSEQDGLSFAQGSTIPRTSTVFGSVAADELAGRDFLDFFGGSLADNGVDTLTFGLRDNIGVGDADCDNGDCPNQPFLLAQRPNARSVEDDGTDDPSVPAPTSLVVLVAGLLALAVSRRGRRAR
jgi:hypothetical protein